jgi:hypothetical protein
VFDRDSSFLGRGSTPHTATACFHKFVIFSDSVLFKIDRLHGIVVYEVMLRKGACMHTFEDLLFYDFAYVPCRSHTRGR